MNDLPQSVTELVREAFAASAPGATGAPTSGPTVTRITDANRGRGVFSEVLRVELTWPDGDDTPSDPLDPARTHDQAPASVVVKMPAPGPNGAAAVASGACAREALAYRRVLPGSPVAHPRSYLVRSTGDSASFVLEDLTPLRHVDQLTGLGPDEAAAVADEVGRLHRHWEGSPRLDRLGVRRSTPASLAPEALEAGLRSLRTRWAPLVDPLAIAPFEHLVKARSALVARFSAAGPVTLCHGDPRADNLAFDAAGRAVLYDWQQIAVQFGAADVAWLAATSLAPETRRAIERDLVTDHSTASGPLSWDDYRLGYVLPGLAVLLLAGRETDDERAEQFIATSIERIGTAIGDLDVAGLRAGSPRG